MNLPAWAVEMLATARVGRLATAGADAQPLVVPVCYVVDAGRIYWAVDAKPKRTRELRRLRNIADNPRVSLVVDDWDENWERLRWVMVDGTAAVLPDGPERTRALTALVAKYPQYAAMDLARIAGAVIAITPTETRAWTAAKESRP